MPLQTDRTALLIVDMQEAFRPAIDGFTAVADSIATLVQGSRALDLPVVVTEQYPRGLGHTVEELARHLEGVTPLEKTAFSATGAEGFDLGGRDQVILCGIESHICVYQSAAALIERGVEVAVAKDAVASRTAENRALGFERMAELGASSTSVEMALFELLGGAGSSAFKEIQNLVK